MKNSNKLFHYTTLDGLEGILQAKCLWATDFATLNDSSEIHYAKRFINNHILDYLKKEDYYDRDDINEISDIVVDSVYKATGDNIFILSFCEHNDSYLAKNGLLSMWRGYKSEVAIGFCKDKVIEKCREITTYFDDRVKYYQPGAKLSNTDEGKVVEIFKFYETVAASSDGDVPLSEQDWVQFIGSCLSLMCLTKHYGFHEENEYRFAYVLPRELDNSLLEKIKWRSQQTKYIEIPISIASIDYIILGPHLSSGKKEYVKAMCKKHQLNCHESEIPFI